MKEYKSAIEAIIENKINRLSRTYEPDKERIEYLTSLLEYFKGLSEAALYGKEETFDNIKMEYLLDNLPQHMAERLNGALRRDKHKLSEKRKKEFEEKKDKKIDAIINHNARKKAKVSYTKMIRVKNKTGKPIIVQKLANQIENNKDNKHQMKANIEDFSDIINWMEKRFVSEFSKRSGGTYYIDSNYDNTHKTVNNEIDEDKKKELKEKFKTFIEKKYHIGTIDKIEELLNNAILPKNIITLLKEYLELLKRKQQSLVFRSVLQELPVNQEYTNTINEKHHIQDLIKKELDKLESKISKITQDIDVDKLYNEHLEEIEKRKKQKQIDVKFEPMPEETKKEVKLDNVKFEPMPEEEKNESKELEDISEKEKAINEENEKWKESFIKQYIQEHFISEITKGIEETPEYKAVQAEAEIAFKKYVKDLRNELRLKIIEYYWILIRQSMHDNHLELNDPKIKKLEEERELEINKYLYNNVSISEMVKYIAELERFNKHYKNSDNTIKL